MVPDKMNLLGWRRKHLDDEGSNDLVREMVKASAGQRDVGRGRRL